MLRRFPGIPVWSLAVEGGEGQEDSLEGLCMAHCQVLSSALSSAGDRGGVGGWRGGREDRGGRKEWTHMCEMFLPLWI